MSAVILAVIVIMWAVVLVPMWLRRHESATENRSVDRFSTAMRVLSRRQPQTPDQRYVVMPRRERSASVHVSGAAASRRPGSARPAPSAPPRPRVRPSIATRRRRALLAVSAVTLLTFVLALVGVVGWVLQLVVDLVLVAYVAHLRTQAKRTTAAARQRRRAAAVPPAPQRQPQAPRQPRPAYRPMPRAATYVPPSAYDEQLVEGSAADATASAEATGTDGSGAEWEPVPVPRPTYTMKPKAPQHWTYEAPAADAPVQQPAPDEHAAVATAEASELDEILEHRRAVND